MTEKKDMREEVRAEELRVGYGEHIVVDGLSFTVHPGQIVTLIGPNGSGKSTILKSIAAQLKILGGDLLLDGTRIEAIDEKEMSKKRAVLLTNRIDPELMSCREIVEAGRYPYTGRLGFLSAADRKAVEEAMEAVHISEAADLPFSQISDGQKQLVLLARAICQEPQLLILDEPTSYLDISHKLELLSLLKRQVRQKHLAVLLSLHEVDLAQRISDLVICIKDGRAQCIGTPEEIFRGDTIRTLYGVAYGSYDGAYGSLELAPCTGAPEVFVIGGGGGGIPVYRRLWREGIPCCAGILPENDIEVPCAKALCTQVILSAAFEGIPDAVYLKAREAMLKCRRVICAARFGSANERCRQLMVTARAQGIPVEMSEEMQ